MHNRTVISAFLNSLIRDDINECMRIRARAIKKRETNATSMKIKTFRLCAYRAYTLKESIAGMSPRELQFCSEKYRNNIPAILITMVPRTTKQYAM